MPASRVGYVYDSTAADYIPFTGPPAALPSGMLTMTAASVAPSGWMLCNGTAISRTTYADLFTAIGTTYGVGDGTTTFNIPDLRGRVPVGTDSSQTEFDALGETGGAKTHTLTEAQLPSHTHSINHDHASFGTTDGAGNHNHSWTGVNSDAGISGQGGNYPFRIFQDIATNWGGTQASMNGAGAHNHTIDVPNFTGTSGSTGSGSAHNNLQPYISINYIIKT
jgi:microcystin-dependent protein